MQFFIFASMKKSLQILLIEDDPDDVELFLDALKDNNVLHTIQVVMQGDEVIPHLEQSPTRPEVILLDLNLPKIHGKEILKILKSGDAFKDIPVVILTTSSARTDVEYCMNAGAEKFITKPTNTAGFDQLVTTITEIAMSKQTEK